MSETRKDRAEVAAMIPAACMMFGAVLPLSVAVVSPAFPLDVLAGAVACFTYGLVLFTVAGSESGAL